ncbi:hypothetical protein BGY98DRAFT_1159686 [Russula aff. rugulosa BPL654]|nr:hypothetical protein BGY98DRAFT_1159686 [Russula aff. rugulosa BPL654]
MSQNKTPDPEVGGGGGPVDDHRDHPTTTTTNQPLQAESNFGDSSGPLFSMYSKAADEEDKRCRCPPCCHRPGPETKQQDISAFYLGNIYQVLTDPNATLSSTPSPVAKPPPFSAPRYSVWVNTLWFLSLVMSVSCALWATSLHQWARRYVRLAQPARCSPENRARMRAFFAGGVDKMHIPWAVEGLPMLLHLSLFLFFGGLAIFLFNVDREVFRM